MDNRQIIASYLRDAEQCLERAAAGDQFQIGAARYKVHEALSLIEAAKPVPPANAEASAHSEETESGTGLTDATGGTGRDSDG